MIVGVYVGVRRDSDGDMEINVCGHEFQSVTHLIMVWL